MFKVKLTDSRGSVKADKEVNILAFLRLEEGSLNKASFDFYCEAPILQCIDFAVQYAKAINVVRKKMIDIAMQERLRTTDSSRLHALNKIIHDLQQEDKHAN